MAIMYTDYGWIDVNLPPFCSLEDICRKQDEEDERKWQEEHNNKFQEERTDEK